MRQTINFCEIRHALQCKEKTVAQLKDQPVAQCQAPKNRLNRFL